MKKGESLEMRLRYKMVYLAEVYNQRPDDPIFKKFSPKAMEGIQELAVALQRAREEGEIK